MKKYYFILSVIILCQSCANSNQEKERYTDFQIKMYESYCFNNDAFKRFVEDYVNLPENKARRVFTLYIDQRMDTMLITIWRNPGKDVKLENSFGYFYFKGKAIIIYSPYFKLFDIHKDTIDRQVISKLYNAEIEYYKTHKQELVMWQLQIPYHGNTVSIQKDYGRIYNTTKPPSPEGYHEDMNYPAD